ncbi:MAG: M28 family peptidase [Anaerolineales bacterium]|nr:M28 family peptidase [Anaerolineales bacterium]
MSINDQLDLIEKDVAYQVNCGPRLPGSLCHQQIREWITTKLHENQWEVETQSFSHLDLIGKNIIGKYGKGEKFVIIGAHYDSRFTADQESHLELRNQPVPGANDGASGVALLLHLSREIPKRFSPEILTIWLVFFDLEDNGNYPGWDWILGSTAFAATLIKQPSAVVVVDMIGDKELNIYLEHNSTPELNQKIWAIAHQLGYQDEFIPQLKYRMIDDHLPFVQRGFPTSLLIDFDYPYWHTTQDTLDKVSAHSIYIVYDTLINWLKER